MKPIGEILIEQGSITKEQLDQALDLQKKNPFKKVGILLIEMGIISEADIVTALSMQYNFPYLPLKNLSVNSDVQDKLSLDFVKSHSVLPIDFSNGTLAVVMSDPCDEKIITEIEKKIKCKVHVFISTLSEVETAIQNIYNREKNDKKEK